MSLIRPIAHIRTDLPQKFGIPRQSGLAEHVQGRIIFNPEFANPDAIRGLEGFSHLWLLWQFENGETGGTADQVAADTNAPVSNDGAVHTNANWSATVRPPKLGGTERMGVFATRSPFRPNPIGLSCVKLDHVEVTKEGPIIHVLGADLRDNTPILDVKPYVPYADCQPDATAGFTERIARTKLAVDFPPELLEKVPQEKRQGMREILEQDPRPVGKHEPGRIYKLAFAGYLVEFTGSKDVLTVTAVQQASEPE